MRLTFHAELAREGIPTHLTRLGIHRSGLRRQMVMPPLHVWRARWSRDMPRVMRLARAAIYQRDKR